mgnify:CR=1 FL=1
MKPSHILAYRHPDVVGARKDLQKVKEAAFDEFKTGRRPVKVMKTIKKAEKKVKTLQKKIQVDIRKTRVETFLAEFIRNGGDPTEAANKAFGPLTHTQAARLGYQMMQESKIFGRALLASKGITYGKLVDIMIDRAYTSKKTDWMDRLLKIGNFHDFLPRNQAQGPAVINIIGDTKDDAKEFGFGGGEIIEGETDDNTA